MSDLATIITAVFGFLTACIVSARMLAAYWFRQQDRLRNQAQTIKRMELQELRSMLDSLKARIATFETKLDVISAKLKSNADGAERVIQAQAAFVSNTEKRIKAIEMEFEAVRIGTVIVKGGK